MTLQVTVPRLKFEVKFHKGSSGFLIAEVPELPGCVTQGRNRRGAPRMVRDAIRCWLEAEREALRRGWKPVWKRGSR